MGASVAIKAMLARPWLAILFLVGLQQGFSFWSRDLWWADEVRQAEVLRHLLDSGDWVILRLNGAPYPDKPHLYFWLMAILARLSGSVEPPTIFFGLSLTFLAYCFAAYGLARRLGLARKAALACVLLLLSCPYILLSAHYARMDFLFGAFVAMSWAAFFRGVQDESFSWQIVSGFAFAILAGLTKGPFGVLFPGVTIVIFLIATGRIKRVLSSDFAAGTAILVLSGAGWIGMMAAASSLDYVRDIAIGQVVDRGFRQDAGWLGSFRYAVTLPLVFLPWSVCWFRPYLGRLLLARAFAFRFEPLRSSGVSFVAVALGASLLVLSISREKHEYYLLPVLPLFACLIVSHFQKRDTKSASWLAVFLAAFSITLAILLPLAAGYAPQEWQVHGVWLAALWLVGTAVVMFALRRLETLPALFIFTISISVWSNIATQKLLPSLDSVYSPRPIVEAMQAQGGETASFASFGLVPGVLAYYLRQPYYEASSIAALHDWVHRSSRPVFVMLERQWPEGVGSDQSVVITNRFILGGEAVVVAQKVPSN